MRFLVLLLALFCCGLPAYAQRVGSYGKAPAAPHRDPDFSAMGIDQKLGEQVPLDLVFRDEHDHEITLGACVGGKPTIFILAYYHCPMLCNQVLNGVLDCVKGIDGDVGDKFNIVAVSFDPKDRFAIAYDKRENFVKEYGRPNADKGIHFLTGQGPAIDELCKSVGFRYRFDKEKKQYDHPSCITILTPYGKVSQYFPGIKYESAEVKIALETAGGGNIGKEREPSEFLKFLCYEYNPETGKYTPSVMKVLRIIFASLVLVMGFWLVRVWRRPPNLEKPPSTEAAPDIAAGGRV